MFVADLLIPSLVWGFFILLTGVISAKSENLAVIITFQAFVIMAGAIILDFLY